MAGAHISFLAAGLLGVSSLSSTAQGRDAEYGNAANSSAEFTNNAQSHWVDYGVLSERDKPLRFLKANAEDVDVNLSQVRIGSRALSTAYERRASRQQRQMDVGAAAVFIGGLGSAFASGAGATSQSVWGGVTFAPLIQNQIHANDPTRDLFHSGVQALSVMDYRYDAIETINTSLNFASEPLKDRVVFGPVCQSRLALKRALEGNSAFTTTLFEKAAETAFTARDLLDLQRSEIDRFRTGFGHFSSSGPQSLAREILALDHKIIAGDRALRQTPREAAGLIIAIPLSFLTTILTGQDGKKALDTLNTNQVLGDLDISLAITRLPPVSDPISMASLPTELTALPTQVTTQALSEDQADVVDCIVEAYQKLSVRAGAQAEAVHWVGEARRVTNANHLRFRLDVATGVATIVLLDPVKEAAINSAPVVTRIVAPSN